MLRVEVQLVLPLAIARDDLLRLLSGNPARNKLVQIRLRFVEPREVRYPFQHETPAFLVELVNLLVVSEPVNLTAVGVGETLSGQLKLLGKASPSL